MNSYTFNGQLQMSQGRSASNDIAEILIQNIPGAMDAVPSNEKDDRNGTDWWVEMERHKLSVDCKVRSEDYALRGKDDLALEVWSVIDSEKVGWTRNPMKRTDYILWLWLDTGRWCLVPFQMLCKVFQEQWEHWCRTYRTAVQETRTSTGTYNSSCVFVPRREVWAEIYRKFGGQPGK